MSINEILEAVQSGGICPFTKKPYDCARCDAEKYRTEWLNKGKHTCHVGLCITRPLQFGGRGWRDTLRFFEPKDRKAARELITQLLKFGVEQVPIAGCDKEHFCRDILNSVKQSVVYVEDVPCE